MEQHKESQEQHVHLAAPSGPVPSALTVDAPLHTPGSWRFIQRRNVLQDEIGVRGQAVCTVWTRHTPAIREQGVESMPWPEGEANARLIAAAPELLQALQDILDTGFAGGPQGKRARAAIAKATGSAA
jgi:hypothetical protein